VEEKGHAGATVAVVLKVTNPQVYGEMPMGVMANFVITARGFPPGYIRCEGQEVTALKERAPECMILLQENGFLKLPSRDAIICEAKPYEPTAGRDFRPAQPDPTPS
jgi:hypothetical protein